MCGGFPKSCHPIREEKGASAWWLHWKHHRGRRYLLEPITSQLQLARVAGLRRCSSLEKLACTNELICVFGGAVTLAYRCLWPAGDSWVSSQRNVWERSVLPFVPADEPL